MKLTYTLTILALAILLVWAALKLQSKNEELDTIKYNVSHLQDTVTYWKNKEGIVVAANTNLQGTIAQLQVTHKAFIDSVKKTFEIKDKQIQGIQKINLAGKTSVATKVDTNKKGDTTSTFTYKQPHLQIPGHTIHDSIYITIHDSVEVTVAESWSRTTFLSPKKHKIQAVTNRDNVTITGLKNVLIIQEKPKNYKLLSGAAAGFFIGWILFKK